MDKNTIQLFGSKKTDHWQTPPEIFEWLQQEFGVPFYDPCPRYPTKDGLKTNWQENTFINPPYSNVTAWFEKAYEEIKAGRTKRAVFLTFANTDTKWFHNHCLGDGTIVDAEIHFWKGRLKFISDSGVRNSAMRPSILITLTPHKKNNR